MNFDPISRISLSLQQLSGFLFDKTHTSTRHCIVVNLFCLLLSGAALIEMEQRILRHRIIFILLLFYLSYRNDVLKLYSCVQTPVPADVTRTRLHSRFQTLVKQSNVKPWSSGGQASGEFHNRGCHTRQQWGIRHMGDAEEKIRGIKTLQHCFHCDTCKKFLWGKVSVFLHAICL